MQEVVEKYKDVVFIEKLTFEQLKKLSVETEDEIVKKTAQYLMKEKLQR